MKHPTLPRSVALFGALLLLVQAAPALAVEPGEPAPSFEARALDGQRSVSLAAFKGKVVYLDFWASWCGPCAAALPAIDSLQKEFADDDFRVLAVNVDQDVRDARRFLSKRPVDYPSVSDPKGLIPERFAVETMPTSFLIDRDGVVQYVHKGFRRGDEKELRAKIESMVAKR